VGQWDWCVPITHDLLSSRAMRMILDRISGGRTPRLHDFLLVKTLLPIWKLTEDESPWSALDIPSPVIRHLRTRVLTDIGTSSHHMRQQKGYKHSHVECVICTNGLTDGNDRWR
jgi:hypothetical protein